MGDIKPGDLVMVVRPTPCCGHPGKVGIPFTVISIDVLEDGMCHACGGNLGHAAYATLMVGVCGDAHGAPLSMLKKIDPPSEGDSLPTRKELNQPTEVM